jgi:hypothetical protein
LISTLLAVKRRAFLLLFLLILPFVIGYCESSAVPEFMPFDAAQPVFLAMHNEAPPELQTNVSSQAWGEWVRTHDLEVRKRLEKGQEDTLINLLRFGVSFTKQPQIDAEYLARYGQSSLVNAFANDRADDLVRALAALHRSEAMDQMHEMLEKKGFSFKTTAGRHAIKDYLLAGLASMQREFASYAKTLEVDAADRPDQTTYYKRRSHLYQQRGISLDTNLRPDYVLDREFKELLQTGAMQAHSIRRVAIVGPGLDFANKESGNDFYPLQTIQPFAVIDSLVRLGLADANTIQVTTFDISANVNAHIRRARKNAALGKPYAVQLPWDSSAPWTPEFTAYWQQLGDQIGKEVPPIKVPSAATYMRVRAVQIPPGIVKRITPVDMNIVFQRVTLPRDQQFDLVIGTNIFVYYGPFEQALARSNMAAMMQPSGVLITNDLLAGESASSLSEFRRSQIQYSSRAADAEVLFSYRRQN